MLQSVSALSTTKSEYVALTEAANEVTWLKGLVNEMGWKKDSVKVKCNSQSVMSCEESSLSCKDEAH